MPPETQDGISDRRYAVFLSYRHADNKEQGRQWATWLHQTLEGYEVPADLVGTKNSKGDLIPASLYPVFRDEEELPADADLTRNIRRALENSELLVVLCSPRAVESRFVADEIRYFKELGKADRVLALMVDGEPNASSDPAKAKLGIKPDAECLPEPLRYGVASDNGKIDWTKRTEPIAADARPGGKPEHGWTTGAAYREALQNQGGQNAKQIADNVRSYEEQLELAKLKVVAGALGVPVGILTARDKAMQLRKAKQRARTLRRWLGAVAILTVLALGGGIIAWLQRSEARKNAGIAAAEAQKARHTLSMSDFYRANELISGGQPDYGLAYLARAIRADASNYAAGRRALFLLQEQPWFIPLPHQFAEGIAVSDVRVLPSGNVVVLGEKENSVGTFDEKGRPRGQLKAKKGNPKSNYADFSFGFEDEGLVYFTHTEGEPPKFWSSVDGTLRPQPTSVGQRETAANLLQKKIGAGGANPGDTSVSLSPSGQRAVAWNSMSDVTYLFELKPDLKELARFGSIFHPNDVAFVPETEEPIAVGGGRSEFGRFGFVEFPNRQKRELPDQCAGVSIAPGGRLVATRSIDSVDLWSISATGYGTLPQAGDAKGTGRAMDFSPDGRQLYIGSTLWKRFGNAMVSKSPGEDPFDEEANTAIDPTLNPREVELLLPEDQYDHRTSELTNPRWVEPLRVTNHRTNQTVTLQESKGLDSAKLTPDATKVIGIRAKNGEGIVWDAKTGGRITVFTARAKSKIVFATDKVFIIETDAAKQMWRLSPLSQSGVDFPAGGWVLAVHSDSARVLAGVKMDSVRLWDAQRGEPIGEKIPVSLDDFAATFSPDGSLFVVSEISGGSGAGSFRVFDTETARPLSRAYSSAEIFGETGYETSLLGDCFFGKDGRMFLSSNAPEMRSGVAYIVLDIPETDAAVPAWMADLAEAVSGISLTPSNATVPLDDDERERHFASIRDLVRAAPLTNKCAAVARWLLDGGPNRVISPGSSLKVNDFVEKRLQSTSAWQLDVAGNASPEDARVFARMAGILAAELLKLASEDRDNTEQLEKEEIRVKAVIRRARRLEPEIRIPSITLQEEAKDLTKPPPEPTPADTSAETEFARGEALRKAGGAENEREAFARYQRAAEMRHIPAMHRIGVMYAKGLGVPQSDAKAVEWYRKAAEKGFAEAQYDLGVRFILGLGVPKDEATGLEWYRKAAAQGWQEAVDALRQRNASHK
jgi:WD40 repeat protein